MTISPVTFVSAAPVAAIEKVQRVKRQPKWARKLQADGAWREGATQPNYVATSPEELASDETRNALLNIRLGG